MPFYTVNKVQPDPLLWQADNSSHPVNFHDVRLLVFHELNIDKPVIFIASCQAHIIGNGVLGSAKARYPPKLARSSKFLAIPSCELILDVKRTPPGRVRIVLSPSWRNGKRRIQAIQMPPSRTVITGNDISTVGSEIAAMADNQVVLAVSEFLVIWLFDESRTVHLDGIVLCSRQTDLFIFAFIASLDTLKILPNFKWQVESFRIDLVDAADNAAQNSTSLDLAVTPTRNTSRTEPLIVWRIVGVHRGFQACAMESIRAAIAAEEFAGTATGTAVFIVFLR